ncbi:hypothetical protein I317_04079 [Kwoniella heveanensis CBS 569]|nr:hypothetical protein I317_04079 [Kwoniella heveanensis CBS 569]
MTEAAPDNDIQHYADESLPEGELPILRPSRHLSIALRNDPDPSVLESLYSRHCDELASQLSSAYLQSRGKSETELNAQCGSTAEAPATQTLEECDEICGAADLNIMGVYQDIATVMTKEESTNAHFLYSIGTLEVTVTAVNPGQLQVWSRFKELPLSDDQPAASGYEQDDGIFQSEEASPPMSAFSGAFAESSVPFGYHGSVNLPYPEYPYSIGEAMWRYETKQIANVSTRLASEAASMLQSTPDPSQVMIKDISGDGANEQFWRTWAEKDWSVVRADAEDALKVALNKLLSHNTTMRIRHEKSGVGDINKLTIQGTIDPSQIKTLFHIGSRRNARTGLDSKAIEFENGLTLLSI